MRGDELPAELQRREKRLAAIAAAKARLEAAQRAGDDARGRTPGQGRNPKGGRPYKRAYGEPEPKAQSNFTDPESRIMNTSTEGFQQCYNAQTAVDEAHQIIVADAGGCAGQRPGPADAVARRGERQLRGRARGGYWPTRATATRRTLWRWRSAASMAMWHWAGRARPGWRSTRTPVRRRIAWARSWRVRRARLNTPSASGCPRDRTAGSRRCWGSDGSACGAWTRCGGEWHLVCLALNIRRLAAMAA